MIKDNVTQPRAPRCRHCVFSCRGPASGEGTVAELAFRLVHVVGGRHNQSTRIADLSFEV